MKEKITYINGHFAREKDAKISVFDMSFLYGDGAFDTLLVHRGSIFKLDAHVERFLWSAKHLDIRLPLIKQEIKQAILETAKRSQLEEGYVRIICSSGECAGIGMRRTIKTKPNVVVLVTYAEEIHSRRGFESVRGHRAIIAATRNIPSGCGVEARAKTNNYLCHIFAALEAQRTGVDFAIHLDLNGFVTECETSNIFAVKNGIVITPPEYVGILAGVTRGTIIQMAKSAGYEVRESLMTPYDLYNSEEVFSVSTAGGVHPIIEVDGRPIGTGEVGPVAKELVGLYLRELEEGEEMTPVYEVRKPKQKGTG